LNHELYQGWTISLKGLECLGKKLKTLLSRKKWERWRARPNLGYYFSSSKYIWAKASRPWAIKMWKEKSFRPRFPRKKRAPKLKNLLKKRRTYFVVKQLDSVEFYELNLCWTTLSMNVFRMRGMAFIPDKSETGQRKWRQDLHRGELSRRNF
jgi:hypothetical protein